MKLNVPFTLLSLSLLLSANAFVTHQSIRSYETSSLKSTDVSAEKVASDEGTSGEDSVTITVDDLEARRQAAKASLFGLIGSKKRSSAGYTDPILADPDTKEALRITTAGTILGGQSTSSVKVALKSTENTYEGRSNTYYNLLSSVEEKEASKPTEDDIDSNDTAQVLTDAIKSLRVFVPPPVRSVMSMTGVLPGDDYIPMRDLFTSPQVSFLYERGWRQGFAAAGFPGADEEYEMVKEYFSPLSPDTVVDMSCATGLFTRRLAKGGDYERVIGCDYSDSMLSEARRRILADADLRSGISSSGTKVDLVRCDVGNIPMQSDSLMAFHAGAAMHCWPDLDSALSEIYRVLKPGGRYFASTFLAQYFRTVAAASGDSITERPFQYFESAEMLKDLLLKAGFDDDKVSVEVLGSSCAIIRAEK